MNKLRKRLPLIVLALLLAAGGLVWGARAWQERAVLGGLTVSDPALAQGMHVFAAGEFQVQLIATGQEHPGGYQGARLAVTHASLPGRWLWYSRRGEGFAAAAQGRETVEEQRGSFFITDHISRRCAEQTIDTIQAEDDSVVVRGTLSCDRGAPVEYTLRFSAADRKQLAFALSFSDPALNRAFLTYASDSDEHFFGFGEQFSYFDHKGRLVPIWISEQGIGRGRQPLTSLVNLAARAGGTPYTTYAAVPHYISSRLRSLFLENSGYSAFDLRASERVQVRAFAPELRGRILAGESPEDLLSEYTAWAGRMRPLPEWILSGALVGLQGGTQRVEQIYAQLKAAGVPVAALWLQDWVGQRSTSFGKQLWWNWELDRERYPGWSEMRGELAQDGVRLMVYTSPFLADVTLKANARRNLFQEAQQAGYLVRRADGQPYLIPNTDFSAGLVDLTNPAAREWYKTVLREAMIEDAGASGWMADFGEALPYDAVLADGSTGAEFHNRYPEAWAALNRELVDALPGGSELVFFQRAAFARSPGLSTLFWEGDQLVAWDKHDGLQSAVTGLLSGGMSGFSLNHSDIGGYTTLDNPAARFHRSKELLLRWMEFSALTTIFRSHEGNLPEANVQVYSDPETLAHFTRMAQLYAAWKPLRLRLVAEAARSGMPVARPLFLHYPDDPNVYSLSQEYLLGSDLLAAPVLEPGKDSVRVYLPAGVWVHLWSGRIYRTPYRGIWVTVPAPLGQPGIFYKEGSRDGMQLRLAMEK